MALRSLVGKLIMPVSGTLRRALPLRSLRLQDKLSDTTVAKIKPLTGYNAEEDVRIMLENINERARVAVQPIVAFRKRQRRIKMLSAASGFGVGMLGFCYLLSHDW